jgi:hypothetical protein
MLKANLSRSSLFKGFVIAFINIIKNIRISIGAYKLPEIPSKTCLSIGVSSNLSILKNY